MTETVLEKRARRRAYHAARTPGLTARKQLREQDLQLCKTALAAGLKTYATCAPCKDGHLKRFVKNSRRCVECIRTQKLNAYLKAPEKSRAYSLRYRNNNLEAAKASQRRYGQTYPDRVRDSRLRATFGITLSHWNEMFERQGNCCAACRASEPGRNGYWATDHCHSTNRLRGILCQPCNIALGLARDSIPVLQGLIAYLELHGQQGADIVKTVADAHASTHAGNVDRAAATQQVPA